MSHRRRVRTAVTALTCLSLAVAGCGSGGSSTAASAGSGGGGDLGQQAYRSGKLPTVQTVPSIAANVPPKIQKDGTLAVVMSTSSPPAHMTTSQGMVGSDADLATLLAKTLGLTPKIVGVPRGQIIAGMKAHRYEVTVTLSFPTAARAKVLDFVNYAQVGTSLGVPSGSNLTIKKLCGTKVGVQKGSAQANMVVPRLSRKCQSNGKKPVSMQTYPNSSTALVALRSSRIKGVLLDSPVMGYAAKQSNGKVKVAGTINQRPVAIGTPEGNGLIKPIQQALKYLDKTGAYEKVMNEWGMQECIIHKFTINAIQNS